MPSSTVRVVSCAATSSGGKRKEKTRRQHRHPRGTDMWPQTPKCAVDATRINQLLMCCRLLGYCAIL